MDRPRCLSPGAQWLGPGAVGGSAGSAPEILGIAQATGSRTSTSLSRRVGSVDFVCRRGLASVLRGSHRLAGSVRCSGRGVGLRRVRPRGATAHYLRCPVSASLVQPILCRRSCLPLVFVVTPTNAHDGPLVIPMFSAVVLLCQLRIRAVWTDAAYFNYALTCVVRANGFWLLCSSFVCGAT